MAKTVEIPVSLLKAMARASEALARGGDACGASVVKIGQSAGAATSSATGRDSHPSR